MPVEIKKGLVEIPIEYYGVAKENLRKFLRDFGGLRIGGIMPYFTEHMIESCFTDQKNPIDDTNGRIAPELVFWEDQRPRYVHIDLGISHDPAGLCISHLEKMERVQFSEESKRYGVEFLPFVGVDLIAGFSPLLFRKKRVQIKYIIGVIFELIQRRGMNVELVTADGYQSEIIFQTMDDEGILSSRLSIDRTTTTPIVEGGKIRKVSTRNGAAAMDCLFSLVDDRRFECPRYPQLAKEGPNLERDEEQSLVYKIPGSTDDVIQAAAGSVFNVVNNAREGNIDEEALQGKEEKMSEVFQDDDDDRDDFVSRSQKNYEKFKKKETEYSGESEEGTNDFEGEDGSFDDYFGV